MEHIFFYESVIGRIGIISNETEVLQILFEGEKPQGKESFVETETPVMAECHRQLQEYFAGERKTFSVPLGTSGTEFQEKVWTELQNIPYGETRSYKDVAVQVGNPKGSRAVGMANNRNRIPIIIPCHRVVGANGKLVGYAGGLDVKTQLLEIEKRNR